MENNIIENTVERAIGEQEEAAPIRPPPGLFLPPGLMQIPEEKEAAAPEIRRSVFSIADHLDMEDDLPQPIPDPSVAAVRSYHELQKTMYEKEKLEKKFKRLQALVTCAEDLQTIQQSVASIDAKKQLQECVSAKGAEGDSQTRRTMWSKKESSKHPGKFYYVNSETGKTTWTKPDEYDGVPVVTKACPQSKPSESVCLKGHKLDLQSATAAASPCKAVAPNSDYDDSTDACSSDSDYDSDFAHSVFSMGSARHMVRPTFRANAPEFKPSSQTGFRPDAPAFQPGAYAVAS
jgi:hypothetical protein